MIIEKEGHQIQRGGLMGEQSFKIALSSKIYSMLSDKLYSDRIGSVTREVCSNAWDGMKMKALATGQPIEPFRVTLPTELEPHFIVEDFGVGMPDEQARELYSTLGLSTKEDSNDQIGAFGLGSKSPFAVTDTFTVENTYDGVTYYYLCLKSEDGLPGILATGSKVEDRPNGVKVIIPSAGHNYRAYEKALQRQLIAMEPKPIVTNGDVFNFAVPSLICENEFGYLLQNPGDFSLRGRTIYVRMGMVLYPVDIDQVLNYQQRSGLYEKLKSTTALIINVPIGAVEPVPSREALNYDPRTIKNIQACYEEYQKIYKQQLIDEVNKHTTPIAAYNEIIKIQDTIGFNLMYEGIMINGWPINNSRQPNIFPKFEHEYDLLLPPENDDQGNLLPPKIEKRKVTKTQFYYESFDKGDLRLNTKRHMNELDDINYGFINNIIDGTYRFLLIDETDPKHKISRMKSVLYELSHHRHHYLFVYVNPNYPGSKTDFTDFIKGLESMHEGVTKGFTYFSKVEKPKVERQARERIEDAIWDGVKYIPPESHTGVELNMRPSSFALLTGEEETEVSKSKLEVYPFEGKAFYLKAFRSDLIGYTNSIAQFKQFSRSIGAHMFVVTKSAENRIKTLEAAGVQEFKPFIEGLVDGVVVTEEYRQRNSFKSLVASRKDWYKTDIQQHIDHLTQDLQRNNKPVPKFIQFWLKARSASNNDIIDVQDQLLVLHRLIVHGMQGVFSDQPWTQNLEEDMSEEFDRLEKEFLESYPIIQTLMHKLSYWDDDHVAIIRDYVIDYTKLRNFESQEVTITPY